MKRVSKSAALAKWNAAMLKVKTLETEIAKTKDEKAIEVGKAPLHMRAYCCLHDMV